MGMEGTCIVEAIVGVGVGMPVVVVQLALTVVVVVWVELAVGNTWYTCNPIPPLL